MCLGIPGQVEEVLLDPPDLARVRINGSAQLINIGLLQDEQLAPGDWMLIHMGFALSRIDEEEAHAAQEFLQGSGWET
jgi:hydrogenase expression/formation protein HypC